MQPVVVNLWNNHQEPGVLDAGRYANQLLADGDSWFAWSQLVAQPSSNLLQSLTFENKTLIISCAYSGEEIVSMSKRHNMMFPQELRDRKFKAILLSGGGNDLIDGLAKIIIPKPGGSAAGDFIDTGAQEAVMKNITDAFNAFADMRDGVADNKDIPIILHTYDFPTPRPAPAQVFGLGTRGPWLSRRLHVAPVPPQYWQAVSDKIYDVLRTTLEKLEKSGRNFHVAHTCNTLHRADPGTHDISGDWLNEIHPTDEGYAKLAVKISSVLREQGIA